ncbi:uncharacterized protein znf654 [Pygocentrus nattereri]|uniref:C2H2-type domain-containing protein n=1 Tax=Pygocentrus nattereri TaxID=42514 RepID=A0A3B4D4Z9_PYGNA|nr:uncharacterized protein znf654 [Pygocentrus nattereri]
MAEEESELELDRFKKALESLLHSSASDEHGPQSKNYCTRFCELVEENTSRWQVPLPQLQVLRSALCAFVHGAALFPSDCEHVRYTLSSLALSVFELLLFFGRDEFPEDPLKDILESFQECHSSLVRYQNVYLLQVRQIIKDGGPWTSPVLRGILKELEQPQVEVDRYLSSELSVFFELRVRYLLACERTREAMALAQTCSQHPTTGRHLFFKQAYLSCLWKASQKERLFKEMAEIDGKDAVEILCIAENEEKDHLLLELSRGFLLQQLRSGDMYYLWDLVFIWCNLYLRVKASKQDLLEECKQLISSATNIKSVFPFMKVILEEHLGRDGLTFCIELCAQALQTDLKNDPITKSLIYKTIAYLLPSDLEICRLCALLVFFLERTVEAYKTVFLLYTHPDQEYHLDTSPVGNHVRFEVIQILKKGLFFDPEFWSLLNIKTNCLKLMSDKVAKAALCEIMEEDKWVPNYCARGHCKCRAEPVVKSVAKPGSTNTEECGTTPAGDASSKLLPPKKRGRKPGSQITKDLDPFPVRRSFRQLDLAQNHARQLSGRRQRFLNRQAEMKTLKRRGRKPRWLLDELASQAENSVPRQGKKPGRKPKQLTIMKDTAIDTPVIEISMEFSYPDNEVDLPADVMSWSVSTMASSLESRFDESKSPCQDAPTQPCDETSISQCRLLSKESALSWREKAKTTEEFVYRAQESIAFLRKFHNYAKVPEENSVGAIDDKVVVPAPHSAEQETHSEVPAPVKNHPSEQVQLSTKVETEVTSFTPAVTQNGSGPLEGTVDANETSVSEAHSVLHLSSVTPVEDDTGPENLVNMLQNSTVQVDEATSSMADTIPKPENALEIAADIMSFLDSTQNKGTDICPSESGFEKATDNVSAPQNSSKTANTTLIAPQTTTDTISTPEREPKVLASAVPKEILHVYEMPSVISGGPKTVAEVKAHEVVVRQTTEDELSCIRPPVTNSSAPVSSPQTVLRLVHCCGLCNKEYRNSSILRHAFWHYRLERKCMFCQSFTYVHGPLCHFKKHIKKLKDVKRLPEEKKSEGSPERSVKPDQAVQGTVPKKPRPGLAQIKSKLLMRLNFRREAAPPKADNNADTDKCQLKQSLTTTSASTQEPEEEKNNKESTPKKKIIYLTRGLVRKSQSKGRFLRKRLARKAKTRTLMKERDVLVTKDGPAHRLNGINRKKQRMKRVQDESNHATNKNVQATTKHENKQQKTDMVGSEEKMENKINCDGNTKQDKADTNTIGKSLNLSKSEAKAKLLQKSGINKKNSRPAKQNEGAKMVKKRKVDVGTDEQKQTEGKETTQPTNEQKKFEASVVKTAKQENGPEAESNETSQSVQKNKKPMRAAPAVVRCPGETCTFSARPGPVLSHVLIHHPNDTKALEFFYDLAKEKCLFCGRRIWTPQHFFDHIVSHRGNLKHPCYHVDCKERFKTRLELGDHMLKDHQPLKAVCCFPGCTVQVSNPKFLYSHERGHYREVRTKDVSKKDKSVNSEVLPGKEVDEISPTAASPKMSLVEMQQMPESVKTAAPQMESLKSTEKESSATPTKVEDEIPLTLNKGSVNYTSKTPRLVNGHSEHEQESPVKTPALAPKEQETDFGKVSTKPFIRPPPSAYLDELYISMPKRWKGPQVGSKGSSASEVSPIKRQVCPRCSASFNREEELQVHREKCTSLFGFDSDDESAS